MMVEGDKIDFVAYDREARAHGQDGRPATPATGPVLGVHVGAMRVALDEALFVLKHTHLPTTANPSGTILAVHYNDLRAGVK